MPILKIWLFPGIVSNAYLEKMPFSGHRAYALLENITFSEHLAYANVYILLIIN